MLSCLLNLLFIQLSHYSRRWNLLFINPTVSPLSRSDLPYSKRLNRLLICSTNLLKLEIQLFFQFSLLHLFLDHGDRTILEIQLLPHLLIVYSFQVRVLFHCDFIRLQHARVVLEQNLLDSLI